MAFEVFNKRKASLGKAPSVTLQRRGILSINRAAFDMIGAPESVELLFDRDRQIIGLRGADDDVPHAYNVRKGKDNGPAVVACMAFTQHYGVDTTTSRRYVPTVEDGILCVDLTGEGVEIVGNRARAKSEGND